MCEEHFKRLNIDKVNRRPHNVMLLMPELDKLNGNNIGKADEVV